MIHQLGCEKMSSNFDIHLFRTTLTQPLCTGCPTSAKETKVPRTGFCGFSSSPWGYSSPGWGFLLKIRHQEMMIFFKGKTPPKLIWLSLQEIAAALQQQKQQQKSRCNWNIWLEQALELVWCLGKLIVLHFKINSNNKQCDNNFWLHTIDPHNQRSWKITQLWLINLVH